MEMMPIAVANVAAIAAVMVGIAQMVAVAFGAVVMAGLLGILKWGIEYEKESTANYCRLLIGGWVFEWMHIR